MQHKVFHIPEDRKERLTLAFRTPGFCNPSEHEGSSGVALEYYLDCDNLFFHDPEKSAEVIHLLSKEIAQWQSRVELDRIAFLEKEVSTTGAIVLAAALSTTIGLPFYVVRLGRIPPAGQSVKGLRGGDKVLVLSDYATEGNELLFAAEILKRGGAIVMGFLVLVLNENKFLWSQFQEAGFSREAITYIYTYERVVKEKKTPVDQRLSQLAVP